MPRALPRGQLPKARRTITLDFYTDLALRNMAYEMRRNVSDLIRDAIGIVYGDLENADKREGSDSEPEGDSRD